MTIFPPGEYWFRDAREDLSLGRRSVLLNRSDQGSALLVHVEREIVMSAGVLA